MIRLSHSATATVAAAFACAVAAPPVLAASTLKVTTCQQKAHDHVEVFFSAFLNPVNAKKSGLTLHYLGGPEVTPFRKQASLLKRGLVDMIFCPTPYYGGQLNEARLIGLHNKSLEEMRKNGAWEMFQEAWGKGLNAHILSWPGFKASTFYIYTKFRPKISEETGLDLTGRKMRSTGLYNPLLKAMNATAVTIAPGDVYAGLERGVVDGMAWPKGSVTKYGWQRFLKFKITPNFYGATFFVIVNKTAYDKLSKAHQALLEAESKRYEADSDALIEKKLALDEKNLAEAGVETIELEGKARKAYLRAIYASKWAQNDSLKYIVDYKKLKPLMYEP